VVTAAVAAMLGLMVIGLANSALALSYQDELSSAASITENRVFDYIVVGTIFASLVPSVLYAVLAGFILHGRQWARVTTWVASGVLMICGTCGLFGSALQFDGTFVGGWLAVYPLVSAFAVVALLAATIVLLALPPANRYFARRPYERNLR
jgi:hypothetical protein